MERRQRIPQNLWRANDQKSSPDHICMSIKYRDNVSLNLMYQIISIGSRQPIRDYTFLDDCLTIMGTRSAMKLDKCVHNKHKRASMRLAF